MADDPKPVEVRSPGYSYDRTNDIRINRDTAERIIARYLRDDAKMLPANAGFPPAPFGLRGVSVVMARGAVITDERKQK